MTTVEVETRIAALPARCFDLARDLDVHARSLAHTGERVTLRPSHARLEFGDVVEFEGRHLGVRQRLRARIVAYDRPRHFRDVMVRGAFRAFVHDHTVRAVDGSTLMIDTVRFVVPGGPTGWLVERAVLRGYLRRLLAMRDGAIRREAEAA